MKVAFLLYSLIFSLEVFSQCQIFDHVAHHDKNVNGVRTDWQTIYSSDSLYIDIAFSKYYGKHIVDSSCVYKLILNYRSLSDDSIQKCFTSHTELSLFFINGAAATRLKPFYNTVDCGKNVLTEFMMGIHSS